MDVVLANVQTLQKGFLGKCVLRCSAETASALRASSLEGGGLSGLESFGGAPSAAPPSERH